MDRRPDVVTDMRMSPTEPGDRTDSADSSGEPKRVEPNSKPLRREHIEIALEIDRLADRCDAATLPFVAYLLRVARAALSEALGERRRG